MKTIHSSKSILGLLISLLLLVLVGSHQAQAAWTKSENSRVKSLEKRVKQLEQLLEENNGSLEYLTIRYLAIGSRSGLLSDICPGPNFEDPQFPSVGRISTGTDLTGSPTSKSLYSCKIQIPILKN